MKRAVDIIIFIFAALPLFGQYPAHYYDSAAGYSGAALQLALHNIIDDHTVIPYDSLYVCFTRTDAKPGKVVWDMYSDVPGGSAPYVYHYESGDECGNYSAEGDCYNREHSFPKSWFGGEIYPMFSDLFHLYPTDGYVNNRRSNYPFGPVSSTSWISLNGSKLGTCSWPGYSGIVFEPVDGYKGDFARTCLYMAVRYYQEDAGWPGSDMVTGSQPKPWALGLLKQWHQADPVSAKEIARNDSVYTIQHNRNPFIDHPEWVNLIWGPSGIYETEGSADCLNVWPNPATSYCTFSIPPEMQGQPLILLLSDVTGQRLPVFLQRTGTEMLIDLRHVSAKVCFLRLYSGSSGKVYTAKIVLGSKL